MPQIVAPSHVSKPPRGTDPAELAEYRDLLIDNDPGTLVSDGKTYATKADAISVAGAIIRGLKWLGVTEKIGARYGENADGEFTFGLRVRATDEDDDEE